MPPFTSVSKIKAKVLSRGPIWFPPNTDMGDAVQTLVKRSEDIQMVE